MPRLKRALRASVIPVAVVLGVLGAGLTGVALTGGPTSAPTVSGDVAADASVVVQPTPAPVRTKDSPGQRPPGQQSQEGGVRDLITGPTLRESKPVTVSIPSLDVESDLVDLRVDSSGAMEVPEEGADAGWYALGPTPGALGPAVIAGHVTWDQAPAVFYRLERLQRGDVVNVTRADGRTAVFSVKGVETYAKARFPTDTVFGTIDHAGLRLITCGGTYDSAANRYLDNVVVFASLVDVV